MIKDWKISAWLASPLAGEPPMLDALLTQELARRLGLASALSAGRWSTLDDLKLPDGKGIPLTGRTLTGGNRVYSCSSPIMAPIAEWEEHMSRRFESSHMALAIAEKNRKSLLTASGPYKQRYAPVRVRLVERVAWFARGDRVELNILLKRVYALGANRACGYGAVWKWEFEEMPEDFSITAPHNGKKILMRPVPVDYAVENGLYSYRKTLGACRPPYWHPENSTYIAEPC